MEKEIQYVRSNLSINYGPLCVFQAAELLIEKSCRAPILLLCLRQWWRICVTEEPRVSHPVSLTLSLYS